MGWKLCRGGIFHTEIYHVTSPAVAGACGSESGAPVLVFCDIFDALQHLRHGHTVGIQDAGDLCPLQQAQLNVEVARDACQLLELLPST